MKEKLDSNQVRQGDVLLVRTGDAENDSALTGAPVVLKHGEVTGHSHRFMADDGVMLKGGSLNLYRKKPLVHEEHAPIEVAPGAYDIPDQVEHQDSDEPRVVAD